MRILIFAVLVLISALVNAGPVDETIPSPWFKNGLEPAKDECLAGIDAEREQTGTRNLTLRCDAAHEGFVGVMQSFSAANYAGKRVMFSARVKSEDIDDGWGGLWMRVDGRERRATAFDNMQNRPITGSTDWTSYAVVLDVAEDAQSIHFGTLLNGKGQLWITDLKFDEAGSDVSTTDRTLPAEPGNLGIER